MIFICASIVNGVNDFYMCINCKWFLYVYQLWVVTNIVFYYQIQNMN